LACILLATPAFAVVNIDYVPVGNAGNAADTKMMSDSTSGYGAVSYIYRISRNETTISQYAEFLNAVAKTDPYGLYNAEMSNYYLNGISQSGSSGSYIYSVNPGSGNKPISCVSWFDAARFCNWLQNGQQTGEGAAITAETGAYTLNGATSGIIPKNVTAMIWIPSEDEWYKAAYYDPNKGGVGVGGYWAQATRSDTLSGNTVGAANSANYNDGDFVGYPDLALTDVGAYGANSASAYGTNDQGGNVWELNDGVISGSLRGVHGGSWNNNSSELASSYRSLAVAPSHPNFPSGFRVATRAMVSLTTNTQHGTVTGAGDYVLGSTATLTATAAPGYVFSGWTGNASGTANPLDLIMDSAKNVTASFSPDTNDPDGDGLTNYQEIVEYHTDPAVKDTDGDGFDDGDEVSSGFNPTDPDSRPDTQMVIYTAVEVRFRTAQGKSYSIESSLDLQTWLPEEAGIVGTGGTITRFYSTQALPKRFFRPVRE